MVPPKGLDPFILYKTCHELINVTILKNIIVLVVTGLWSAECTKINQRKV